jgi:anaerobic magnesium-protoporphyrin IX monomethyl ester cyclase
MKLKIMLINPPRVNGFPVVREERFEHKDLGSVYPPLSLLYAAAVLEKNADNEIKFLDANGFDMTLNRVNSEILAFNPDVVISRTGFDTQKQDIEVLAIARSLGAITVLRSKIIADVPDLRDELLKNDSIDIFINSEPEAVVGKLCEEINKEKQRRLKTEQPESCLLDPSCREIDDWNFLLNVPGISFYANGKAFTTLPAKEISDIDTLPYPAYHFLPSLKPYHTGVMDAPFALVQTTRGCPFKCTFCAFSRSKCRDRSVESVISEIKYLKDKYGIKSFLFFDDTISIRQGRLEELCRRMIEEKLDSLKWGCCTRANLVSYEMLKVMKEAGMKEIAIGIETGSAGILKDIKKGVTLDEIRQCAKWCHELKIMFYGLAIIGLPGETKQTVGETVEFIKEIDPFYTQFCFSTPFPNTEMYEYYEENNFLLTKDWEKYFPLADEPVVRTQELSADELKKLRAYAYTKILLRPMYLLRQLRPFDWKWNISGTMKIAGRIWRVLTGKAVR